MKNRPVLIQMAYFNASSSIQLNLKFIGTLLIRLSPLSNTSCSFHRGAEVGWAVCCMRFFLLRFFLLWRIGLNMYAIHGHHSAGLKITILFFNWINFHLRLNQCICVGMCVYVCRRATVACSVSNLKWNCRGPVTWTPIFHFQSITGQFMTSMCCARIFVNMLSFISPCAIASDWMKEDQLSNIKFH